MPDRITPEQIEHVARLARLALTAEEVTALTDELAAVLDHARDIAELDLDDVEPTNNPLAGTNVWRDDIVGATLDRDEVLAAAPAAEDDRFSVPAILGSEP